MLSTFLALLVCISNKIGCIKEQQGNMKKSGQKSQQNGHKLEKIGFKISKSHFITHIYSKDYQKQKEEKCATECK